jgi:hypothetical protein
MGSILSYRNDFIFLELLKEKSSAQLDEPSLNAPKTFY